MSEAYRDEEWITDPYKHVSGQDLGSPGEAPTDELVDLAVITSERSGLDFDRLRHIGQLTVERARNDIATRTNQFIHEFGSRQFWYQMRHPVDVETSFGTSHKVRVIGQEKLHDQDTDHVLIINPLGTSSAGGYMAELAHIFYEAGFVVWNVSPPGFEGKLPLKEARRLTVKQQTRYLDECLDAAALKLAVDRPAFHKYGGSQGGGLAIGLLYRDIAKSRETGKTVAVTPSSGHNTNFKSINRALRYANQFLFREPAAIYKHLAQHPKGSLRRAKQLLPTVNVRPSALMQMAGAGIGLIFTPGHEEFLAQAETEENAAHFDSEKTVVFCFTDDVVARAHKWPEQTTREIKGLHMDVVDERYARFAAAFFDHQSSKIETEVEEVLG